MVRKSIYFSFLFMFLVFFLNSVLAEEVGCCVVSKAVDRCLNAYPKGACISDFFVSGTDCSQVNSCERGCCQDSCSETFSYECSSGFLADEYCDEVAQCQASCYYYSLNSMSCTQLIPCFNTAQNCNFKNPEEQYELCMVDSTKNQLTCVNDIPLSVQKFNISGTVEGDGNRLSGVRVYLSSGLAVDTDSNGHYKLVNAPKGSYKVFFSKKGYLDNFTEIDVVDSSVDDIDKNLVSSNEVILDGYVHQGSQPIPGVTLNIKDIDNSINSYYFVANDDGYYISENIEPGTYVPKIYDLAGNVQEVNPSSFTISDSQSQNFTFGSSSDDDVTQTYNISGFVNVSLRNENDDINSTGANIMLLDRVTGVVQESTTVDSFGNYEIETSIGNYYLQISKPGFLTIASTNFYLRDDSEFNFTLLQTLETALDEEDKGNLTVYVHGCDEGSCSETQKSPLEEADVFLFLVETVAGEDVKYAYNTPKKTDSNGKVVFENINTDLDSGVSYYLEVKKQGYDCGDCSKEDITFNTAEKTKEVGSDKSIYLIKRPMATLTGRVGKCNSNGNIIEGGLENFLVYIPEIGKKSEYTSSKGNYQITGISYGNYTLFVSDRRDGEQTEYYLTKSEDVTLDSSSVNKNICLEPITCSLSMISENANFVPTLANIEHKGDYLPKFNLSIQAAQNPNGCNVTSTTVVYCRDDECSFNYEGENYEIVEGFNVKELETDDVLLSLAFDFRDENRIDESDFVTSDYYEYVATEENNYCFAIAQTYNSSEGLISTRLSQVNCIYSGIKPCLQDFESFCFDDDQDYGLNYNYFPGVAEYTGSCNEEYYVESFRQCPAGMVCFLGTDKNAVCRQPNFCEQCSDSMGIFQDDAVYYDEDDDSTKSCSELGNFCFIDRNYDKYTRLDFISNADVYKSCNMVSSCYDYKNEETCEANPCFNGTGLMSCSWNESSFSGFGDGVCVPQEIEHQNCSLCHDPMNRFFGLCNEERCDLFGDCYFRYTPLTDTSLEDSDGNVLGYRRDLDINYRCVSSHQVSCEDYNTKEDCLGLDGTNEKSIYPFYYQNAVEDINFNPDNNNSVSSISNDTFNLGNCRWRDDDVRSYAGGTVASYYNFSNGTDMGYCYKDSDFSSITTKPGYQNKISSKEIDCGSSWSQIFYWQYFEQNPLWSSTLNSQTIKLNHECSLDNEPGNSTFMKIIPKPILRGTPLKLVFSIDDNKFDYFRTLPGRYEKSNEYVVSGLIVNNSPIVDVWGEKQEGGKGFFEYDTQIYGKNRIILDYGYVPSGEYDLHYFLRDASNNLEILKTDKIQVVSEGPGVIVNWTFESNELETSDPNTKKYKSDLTILTAAFRDDIDVYCQSELIDENGDQLFIDLNPLTDELKGNNWTVTFPSLDDGNYKFRVKCRDDLNYYSEKYRVNHNETSGYEEISDSSNWAEIEIEINSDRNLRFEPKVLTIQPTNIKQYLKVYTAVPSTCKILKAQNSEMITPLRDGGFYDIDEFENWGSDSVTPYLLTEPKTYSQVNPPIIMRYAHEFEVDVDNLDENVNNNYYIWCKHEISNNEIIYSNINEINKFVIYIDSEEPQLYFQDYLKNSYSINVLNTTWFNSRDFERYSLRCIDRGSTGNEFGKSNTNENMTVFVNGESKTNNNALKLFGNFETQESFDFDYTCYDFYDEGNILSGSSRINIDDVQPKIKDFNLTSSNLQGSLKFNVCNYPVLKSPVGDDLSYLAIDIGINDFVVEEISKLENFEFDDFKLVGDFYVSPNDMNDLKINFREYNLEINNQKISLKKNENLVNSFNANYVDSLNSLILNVTEQDIEIYLNDELIISEIDDTIKKEKIEVLEDSFYFEEFGIISKKYSSPLDIDNSEYKIGLSSGKTGLVKYSNNVFLMLTSDELEKDKVNEIRFKIMDVAKSDNKWDINYFNVVLDSKEPYLKAKNIYTVDNTEDFGEPNYEITEDYFLAEYDLESYIDFELYDPGNEIGKCSGSGIETNFLESSVLMLDEDGTEYWNNEIIQHSYNQTSKILKLNITELSKKTGEYSLRLNISDKVENRKIHYFTLKIEDSMGPRFSMELKTEFVNYDLSHYDETPVLGSGLYEFCLSSNSDDIDKDTFELIPTLPYLALVNFDKESMCGNMSIVSGTKYSRNQRALPFEILVKDKQKTQGGITVNFKIDTMQPPLVNMVPSFEEYLSGNIDNGIFIDMKYPVNSISYPQIQGDLVSIYTNVSSMVVTGFAPEDVDYIKYHDATGVRDVHDYIKNNDPILMPGVNFNLTRDIIKNSTNVYVSGEWVDMFNSLLQQNNNEFYLEFISDDNQYFRRNYENYGKYYLVENVSTTQPNGQILYSETRLILSKPLDYDLKQGDEYKIYKKQDISNLFRLNLSLKENDETVFYIKSLNDIKTENYMKPIYRIFNDNVSPVINEDSIFPPYGTYNKPDMSLIFNVTEDISGISREGVNIYLNDVLVNKSDIYVSYDEPDYRINYIPSEDIKDGFYDIFLEIYDRSGNFDTYRYNFTMASGAPDMPKFKVKNEVYNLNDKISWIRHKNLEAEIFFDDTLEVTVENIQRVNLDASSFSSAPEFEKISNNKYSFRTNLIDIDDNTVYEFWYDVKAYRTFSDGNVSPSGIYRLKIVYDKVPPNVNFLDKGKVRRFRPQEIYEVLMTVDNENYDLNVEFEMPLTWEIENETDIIELNDKKQVDFNNDLIDVEFLGFSSEIMGKIGLDGEEIDFEYLNRFVELNDYNVFNQDELNSQSRIILESGGNAISLKKHFYDNRISNAPVAVLRIDGITYPVGFGEFKIGNYEIFVEDIYYVDNINGAIKITVNNVIVNQTRNDKFGAKIIRDLGKGNKLYSGNYDLSNELIKDQVIPFNVIVSDFGGNKYYDDLKILVDTIKPKYDIINVTMVDLETNNSRVLTKKSYDDLSYWTNDKIIRIVARMVTPDIVSVRAVNKMLDRTYIGFINENSQTFYVDVELKGEYQKEELNSIEIIVHDEVGYNDTSGLFVERDLLAPDLKNIIVESR